MPEKTLVHSVVGVSIPDRIAAVVEGTVTGPSQIYDKLLQQSGRMLSHQSIGTLPSLRSIKYQRSLQRETSSSSSTDSVADPFWNCVPC